MLNNQTEVLMSKEYKSDGLHSLSRRNFLGALSLGIAGIAGMSISISKLVSKHNEPAGLQTGIPEDSIFKPRDNKNDSKGQNKA